MIYRLQEQLQSLMDSSCKCHTRGLFVLVSAPLTKISLLHKIFLDFIPLWPQIMFFALPHLVSLAVPPLQKCTCQSTTDRIWCLGIWSSILNLVSAIFLKLWPLEAHFIDTQLNNETLHKCFLKNRAHNRMS